MTHGSVKEALQHTISCIQADPAAAKMVYKSETSLVHDMICKAKIRELPSIVTDEPFELGGSNSAPNPMELILAALGTCQEVMYSAYASVMGIPLTSVKVSVKGEVDLRGALGMDQKTPAGFTRIQYFTTIESPAPEAELANLAQIVETHCPVLDTLSRPVAASGTIRINGRKLEPTAV